MNFNQGFRMEEAGAVHKPIVIHLSKVMAGPENASRKDLGG
jgi:hypothetical protein